MKRIEMTIVEVLPVMPGRISGDGCSYASYPGIVYVKPSGIQQGIFAVQAQRRKNPSALVPTCVLLQDALDDRRGKTVWSQRQPLEARVALVDKLKEINRRDEIKHPDLFED
ncbi:MAG: hypothetical protein SFV17_12735 [Candidatus Obscuribacter sp.]|nr:hypothetical protein [Candidatus Melainabacteria bacterium]MDX1987546.1 hypothetical protein [Candidatus Obscuribacter sp.]